MAIPGEFSCQSFVRSEIIGPLARTGTVKAKSKAGVSVEEEANLLQSDPRWKLAERVARGSALFRATQLRDMLLFIVRQTILNPDEPIHEFDIAYQALGRRSDFNPLDDNIVRVQMAHLRKKLDVYFSTEGQREATVITVALGTYKPLFSPRAKSEPTLPVATDAGVSQEETPAPTGNEKTAVQQASASDAVANPASPGRRPFRLDLAAAFAVILVLAAACSVLWVRNRNQQDALDSLHHALSPWKYQPALNALWSGFLDSNHDTDIVLSDDSFLLIEELNKQQTPFYGYLSRSYLTPSSDRTLSPELRFVQALLASKSLGNTSEFKLAQRILALDPLGKKIHMYSARQYMPALVKQDNVILIGGRVSNPWSELFENRLNFVEDTKFEGFGITIVENRSPAAGEPQTYTSTDAVGYCVVAYMPNPGQEGKVLLLEGTSSEATEAAGDFLLSGEQFSAFLQMLHATGLPYFEVLLKTSQVRGTPLTATVQAYRVYPNLH